VASSFIPLRTAAGGEVDGPFRQENRMTSRDRVFRALEFRHPDRPPRDLWTWPWHPLFEKDALDSLYRQFPMDFTWAGVGLAAGDRRRGQEGRTGTHVDDWGCVWHMAEDGVAGEVKGCPLADWSALATYRPPWETLRRTDWAAAEPACRRNLAGECKFMMGGSSVRPFERIQFLRGSENVFLDLGSGDGNFRRLLAMIHEFFLAELEYWCRTPADAVTFMDDWGSQKSLLISPAMWREVFKPLYREYCGMIRSAGKKVFFHSDGYIQDIYEDLVEIGVDAVNSQLFCMDIEEISRRWKGRITFWGELDRQQILPFGTVRDVRAAVGRVRRALEDPAGGVIAHCTWSKGDPLANIQAVYQAWDEPVENLP
jgi:hypothetical protein